MLGSQRLFIASTLLLAACGASSPAPSGDAAPPSDAAPPGDAAPAGQQGNVVISQTVLAVGPATITTAVHAATFGSTRSGCTERREGACVIHRCPTSAADAGAPAGLSSAGAITFSGGMGAPITIMPGPDGRYMANTGMMARWRSGEVITVRAAGAMVPAFEAMVPFPATVMVTQPAVSPTMPVRVPRGMPLVTRWTAMGAGGEVKVSVASADSTTTSLVTCGFPPAAGTGTIPATALSDLVVGQGSFSVTVTDFRTVTAGAWNVAVAANATGAAGLATVE